MKINFRCVAMGVLSATLFFNSVFSSVAFATEDFAGESTSVILGSDPAEINAGEESKDVTEDAVIDDASEGAVAQEEQDGEENDPEDGGYGSEISGEASESGSENEQEVPVEDGAEGSSEEASAEGSSEEASADASKGEATDPLKVPADPALKEKELEEDGESRLFADPYSGKCGESATWKYDTATKVLTISGNGRMYDYDIDIEAANQVTTTTPWFQYASDIKDVVISDDITYIGKAAFTFLKSDRKVFSLPSSLEELGAYAFYYFKFNSDVTLNIPGSVKVIPDHCFSYISGPFGKIMFNEGTTTIGDHAFYTSHIQVGQWADSIASIGDYAFDFAMGPVDYVIPKGIKKIGRNGFYHIQHIKSVTFLGDMPSMDENAFGRNSVIAYYDPKNTTFSKAARDKAAQYFEDVTWRPIGYNVSDKAGDKITWRYDEAERTLFFEGEGAMYDYTSSNLPDWFIYAKKVTSFYFDQRITEIGDYTFYRFGDFRQGSNGSGPVILPKNLKRIGKYAFSGDVFYNVTMPETAEIIDDGAFYVLQFWDSTVFPKGVKWIGDNAFKETYFKDTKITLDSIEHIGSYGLYLGTNCSNNTMSYSFPGTLKYIGDHAFNSKVIPINSKLSLPSGLEYIGESAFSNVNLTGEVIYPSSVKQVSNYVFSSTGIESVVFDKTLEDVAGYAFKRMSALKKLTFKGSFPNLKKDVFYGVDTRLTVYYPFDDETWLDGISSLNYKSELVEFVPVGGSTTVTFVGPDGAVIKTQTVAQGAKVSAPTITLKSGQELGGWYTSKTIQYEGTKWYFDSPVRNRMTLYAGLKYAGHKVVFYPLNGKETVVKTVPDGKTLENDKDVKKLQEYSGYRFLGWYTSKNFAYGTEFKLSEPVDRDVAVYANWTVFQPQVEYNNDRYAFVSTWRSAYTVGEAFSYDEETISYYEEGGYAKFLGWYYDKDFKKPVTGHPAITKDITFYGKWDIVKHKVTFNYGDERAPLVIEVEHWENLDLPQKPERVGFDFKGWSKTKEGTSIEWTGPYNVREDLSYYAVWEARPIGIYYVITYKNGGKSYHTEDIHAGEKFIDASSEFAGDSLEGYDFKGWFTDEKYTKPITTSAVLYENTTVYGKITPKLFTVTLNPDNGEKPYIYSVEYGEGLDRIIPVKKGYEFTGWTNEKTGTTSSRVYSVYSDCSYKARWSQEYNREIEIIGIDDQTYTGSAITFPKLRIINGSAYALKNGKDYTVKYKNNVKAGTATINISYKGGYRGKSTVNFRINQADLNELKADGLISSSFEETYLAYNKKVQKAKPKITCELNDKIVTLKENTDYKLVYVGADPKASDYNPSAFKEIGKYIIKVVGIGNYCGEYKLTEVITGDKPVEKLSVTGLKKAYSYTGGNILPAFVVRDGKTVVGEYTDGGFVSDVLDCRVTSNVEVGTAEIVLAAKKDKGYAGGKRVAFNITGTPISKAVFEGFLSAVPYDGGKEIKQNVNIYKNASAKKTADPNGMLVEGKDYAVSYIDNKEVGKATVIYAGIGAYSGEVKKNFNITGKSLKKMKVTGVKDSTFTGKEITQPALAVTDPATGKTLTGIGETELKKKAVSQRRGFDYVISYESNIKKGTAKVILTGLNGYTDKVTKTFKIGATDISKFGTLSAKDTARYTRKGCRPDNISVKADVNGTIRTLYEGVDYTVSCSGTAKAGNTAQLVVTGKGNYSGKLQKTFTVESASLTNYSHYQVDVPVFADKVGNFVSKINIYDEGWSKLTPGVDYEKITYYKGDTALNPSKDRIRNGENVKAVIRGMGNYKDGYYFYIAPGTKAQTIGQYDPPKNISSCTFTLRDYTYKMGSEVRPNTGYNLVVKDNGKTVSDANYTVIGYENNTEIGTAAIIIQGRNKYKGTYRVKFRILPRVVEAETTTVK